MTGDRGARRTETARLRQIGDTPPSAPRPHRAPGQGTRPPATATGARARRAPPLAVCPASLLGIGQREIARSAPGLPAPGANRAISRCQLPS
ncbi:hypothetical protein, partial [Streptomyces sp. WAC05374]|uniref:hypothetical protein n=1 Tax=Streptomyces sp. WAC05374 TaxID=2487420 RepID=UPI001C8DAEDD